MRTSPRRLAATLLALAIAAAPCAGALAQAARTGKERMVEKARDPQRVDDCKVPIEKRDPARSRPDCGTTAAPSNEASQGDAAVSR